MDDDAVLPMKEILTPADQGNGDDTFWEGSTDGGQQRCGGRHIELQAGRGGSGAGLLVQSQSLR
jgi:hypothetical protein